MKGAFNFCAIINEEMKNASLSWGETIDDKVRNLVKLVKFFFS